MPSPDSRKGKSNVMVIHGGGNVDPAKVVLLGLARALHRRGVYEKIFLGSFSFESLYLRDFWQEYTLELEQAMRNRRGTVFGTCRGIDLTKDPLASRAVRLLKEENVSLVVITGGDGSSRNVSEMVPFFEANGINLVFAMPLTVDGINGGKVIGRRQAKRESIRQVENIASTALNTRDEGKFGVCIAELQGRNRDDILVGVLENFVLKGKIADFLLEEEVLLFVVPATIETDVETLVHRVKRNQKRTLLLVSEGAKIATGDLTLLIEHGRPKRKVRSLIVGHPTQSNNQTTWADEVEYQEWIDFVANSIVENPGKSFSTSQSEEGEYSMQSIDYYASLNPRDNQIVVLSPDEIELIKEYMIEKR